MLHGTLHAPWRADARISPQPLAASRCWAFRTCSPRRRQEREIPPPLHRRHGPPTSHQWMPSWHALYDVISGPAGPRDWDRFRSLFVPGARLIPTRHDSTGHVLGLVLSPDDYARRAGAGFSKNAFYERQIGKTAETFGAITQVFSAYASRHGPNDPEPFARGINSIQLFNDGTRWYVVTIYWDAERGGNKIPAQYL